MHLLLSFFLLINLSTLLQAQSVTGSYSLDFDKSLLYSPANRQADFAGFEMGRQQRIRSVFAGRIFLFTSDGQLKITWMENGTSKRVISQWTLSGGVLTVINLDNTTQNWEVIEVTSDHLIIDLEESGGGLFSHLYLTRS